MVGCCTLVLVTSQAPISKLQRAVLTLVLALAALLASHLQCPAKVLLSACEPEELQEGIGISRCAMAEATPFQQQTTLPDYFPTVHSSLEVPLVPKRLHGEHSHTEACEGSCYTLQVTMAGARLTLYAWAMR